MDQDRIGRMPMDREAIMMDGGGGQDQDRLRKQSHRGEAIMIDYRS